MRNGALLIAALVLVQIYLGALVAGLDAGMIFNTWPDIDGGFIPNASRLWFATPWWRNLFENTLTVQFDHRMLAYAIWVLAGLHAIDARQARQRGASAVLLWLAVTLQAMLGVFTLLWVVPIALAMAHQAMAIVVLDRRGHSRRAAAPPRREHGVPAQTTPHDARGAQRT